MRTVIAPVIAILSLACLVGETRADEWQLLGERRVDLGRDRDVIPVTGLLGKFKKIKLKVVGKAVHLIDLKVHFENGTTQDVPVRTLIRAGSETRVIDLPGQARRLRKIDLVYRTLGRRRPGKATVRVFGKRDQKSTPRSTIKPLIKKPATTPIVKPTGQWELLGQRTVSFATDRDRIPVTALRGTYHKIKLRVTQSAVHMLDLKVHFRNGTTQDVAIRRRLDAGSETRVIDLPGADRVIQSIDLVYRSVGPRTGRAHVKVLGKQKAAGLAGGVRTPPTGTSRPLGPWERLGQRTVNFTAERDTIGVTAADGRFRKIKLKVKQRAVRFIDLKVTYGNGTVHDVSIRSVIRPGGETRVIDLPGADRVIRNVSFVYKTAGRPGPRRARGRATVELWGRH